MDWEATLHDVAVRSWRESHLYEMIQKTPELSGAASMLSSLYIEAYKRGAKDTMVTLKAMQAIDVTTGKV